MKGSKKNYAVRLACTGCALAALLFSVTVFAELDPEAIEASLAKKQAPKISKSTLVQLLAKSVGMDASDQRIVAYVNNQVSHPPPSEKVTIVKHLKADGGTPFSSSEAFEKALKEEYQRLMQNPKIKAKIGKPIVAKSVDIKPVVLKACKGSTFESQQSGYAGNPSRAGKVQFDYLFIDNQDLGTLRSERTEIFGAGVNIKIIGADQVGAESTARGFNVECLPTRIRATREAAYRLTGELALRNYEKSPNGPGVLHELMKKVAEKYN